MTVGLCLLTLNEIDGCRNDVPCIDRSAFEQIYCVDGGSTDGTIEYLKDEGIGVYSQTAAGYNQAIKDAVEFCNCECVVLFHPKGSIPVSDTLRFRDYFEQGYDLVVASRMMKGAVNEEDKHLLRPRKWFVLIIGSIARLLFRREGETVLDVLHGFRGVRVQAFKAMHISDRDPSADLEMVCRAYKQRMKRIEFPTTEGSRISGKTHFRAFSSGRRLIAYLIYELGRKE